MGPKDRRTAAKIVSPEKVTWLNKGFKSYKSQGEHLIFPLMLQKGPETILMPLAKMIRTSSANQYILLSWRVVFIMKPRRTNTVNTDKPGTQRLVCPTSVQLKTLKRLDARYIRDEALNKRPLRNLQFAYITA